MILHVFCRAEGEYEDMMLHWW